MFLALRLLRCVKWYLARLQTFTFLISIHWTVGSTSRPPVARIICNSVWGICFSLPFYGIISGLNSAKPRLTSFILGSSRVMKYKYVSNSLQRYWINVILCKLYLISSPKIHSKIIIRGKELKICLGSFWYFQSLVFNAIEPRQIIFDYFWCDLKVSLF